MARLEQLADEMNIRITTHEHGNKGAWNPDSRTISLRKGMHPTQTLCTLAHELGHAHHAHTPGATGLARDQQEREADEWAARLLIDEDAYMSAELECGHVGALAEALGVTVHMVQVWRRMSSCARGGACGSVC